MLEEGSTLNNYGDPRRKKLDSVEGDDKDFPKLKVNLA